MVKTVLPVPGPRRVLVLALLVTIGVTSGLGLLAVILPPIILTNSAGGVEALRALVSHSEVQAELGELTRHASVWRVCGLEIPSEELPDGGEGYEFHFDLAAPAPPGLGRGHARVLRLSYRLHRPLFSGEFSLIDRDAGLGSIPEDLPVPVVPTGRELQALRLALGHDPFHDDLVEAFGDAGDGSPLVEMSIAATPEDPGGPELSRAEFELQLVWRAPRQHPETRIQRFRVELDEAAEIGSIVEMSRE